MLISIRKILMVITLILFNSQATFSQTPSFSSVVIDADYKVEYQYTINSTVEYLFLYPVSNVSIRILYKLILPRFTISFFLCVIYP